MGTKDGAKKARETNMARYGKDWYAKIGRKGGQNGKGPDYKGGFAGDKELARKAGAKGGKISKRGPAEKKTKKEDKLYRSSEQIINQRKKELERRIHNLEMGLDYVGFFQRRRDKKEIQELTVKLEELK